MLKCKRDVGDEGILVWWLRLLPPVRISKLRDLLNLFILSNYVSNDFVYGNLTPIVKNRKVIWVMLTITDVGNLSKLFDAILLEYLKMNVEISNVQFNFKKSCTTDFFAI